MKTIITLIFLIVWLGSQLQVTLAIEPTDTTNTKPLHLTKVERDLRDDSIWYFHFGYFPATDDFTSGLSFLLGNAHQVSNYLNLGWQAQLVTAFEEKQNFSGYMSLYMTFDSDFRLGSQLLFVRGGVGFIAFNIGLLVGGILELEYVLFQFSGLALSISASQTFARFKYLGPTIISVGIIF